MAHVYPIITSVYQETFTKDVLPVNLDIKLLMEFVENFLIIVPSSISHLIVSNVHLDISFTAEFVTRPSQTASHKELHSATSVILCMPFQTIKDHVFLNNQFVTVNNMTLPLISVLFVRMVSE